MNNKSIFVSTLSDQFRISAHWRDAKAKSFSHDAARNGAACKRLLKLESEIVIPDDVWQTLQPLISDPVCLSETNRDVAFRTFPRDFADWLEHLRTNLARQ